MCISLLFYRTFWTRKYQKVFALNCFGICIIYIADVKSTRRYAGKRIRTEYSCTIHYTFTDGKDYYCEEEGLIEKPDENLSKVWVSRDNKDVHMYSLKVH